MPNHGKRTPKVSGGCVLLHPHSEGDPEVSSDASQKDLQDFEGDILSDVANLGSNNPPSPPPILSSQASSGSSHDSHDEGGNPSCRDPSRGTGKGQGKGHMCSEPPSQAKAKGLAGADPGLEPFPLLPYKLGGVLTMPFPLVQWQVIKCNLKAYMCMIIPKGQ